jgi:NitT/TauT family transport system ATP-binding protein
MAEIAVDIPRPRDQIETKALPEFVELRAEVARLIRSAGSSDQEPDASDPDVIESDGSGRRG